MCARIVLRVLPFDTEVANLAILFNVPDPKLVSRAVCRVSKATFTGNRHWAYPQHWHEPIMPLDGQ